MHTLQMVLGFACICAGLANLIALADTKSIQYFYTALFTFVAAGLSIAGALGL